MKNKSILYINLRSHKVERVKPIQEAKKLGLRVVLLADETPNMDTSIIDDIIITDTFNHADTLKIVREYNEKHPLCGVLTWSDKDVELLAKIGENLGLKTLSKNSAILARNKYSMRRALNRKEGLCPKFHQVQEYSDLEKAVKDIGFPAILKPVGASGSKAILKVEHDTDLRALFEEMLRITEPKGNDIFSYYPNEYIYEEYIDGEEVCVDGLVKDGEIYIAGVTDKYVTENYSLEFNAFFPSKHNNKILEEIKEKVINAIKCLELNNCPFHIECRVSSSGVRIIEVGARAGGGFVTSHIIEYATNYSLHELIIRAATGLDFDWPDFDSIKNKYAGMFMPMANKEGTLKNIDGIDLILEDENIKFVSPIKKIGSYIKLPPEDFSPHLAYILAEADSYENLVNSLEKAQKKYIVDIK